MLAAYSKKEIIRLLLVSVTAVLFYGQSIGQPLLVNSERLQRHLAELSGFGRDSLGRGYRVAYTPGDLAARDWIIGLMKKAGLEVHVDFAGNIIGRRAGKNPALKPIAFGSHIDMVPDGGNYDGCLGALAALELIETLNDHGVKTNHLLEVIIFSNEEGGTMGSRSMAGNMTPAVLAERSPSGLTNAEGIRFLGGNPDSIARAARKNGDIQAFVELHIEQGSILEKSKIPIGVVEGIVGILHWEVTVTGLAGHAGTTPMDSRKDALVAAARFILAANEVIRSYPGRQVGTVGKIDAYPGAFNVIPGKVVLGLEIRDLSEEKMWRLFKEIAQKAKSIDSSSGTATTFKKMPADSKPVYTDKGLQQKIITAAKTLGLSSKLMQSGAAHDAGEMTRIAPSGMNFIPSVRGISHNPLEYSKPMDLANGANVLLRTVLGLDGG